MRKICRLALVVALVVFPAVGVVAEELTLPTSPGHLAGTLLVPDGSGPWPVTLILAGTGSVDRDGNVTQFPGGNNSLKQLAESLAVNGVASLRVDNRGVAGSESAAISEFDLRFDDFIADAVAWCERLQSDTRFSSLTVIGHGQGAQVGMNAAWLSDADGFVALNGPGRNLLSVLRDQLASTLPVRTRVKAEEVIKELELGRAVLEPPVELTVIFRPSVQEFLMSWDRHDPQVEIARLPLPVLVVQGTTDEQVPEVDAEELAGAKVGAKLLMVEGMNHVLKMVEAGNRYVQQSSLVDSTLLIAPVVPAAILELVREAEAGAESRKIARRRVGDRAAGSVSRLMMVAVEDSVLAGEQELPTATRVGLWARRFADDDKVRYLFGPKPDGYVATGAVVSDREQDCVSLLYRVGELARARDARDAVDWALRTRFAGAVGIVATDGRLDYDDPAHLDFSLDMIRTGMWGRDVTPALVGATADTVGSSRYAAGSFQYVPKSELQDDELSEGDVVWFVLDPAHESGAKLRREYGLVIGHIGFVIVDEGQRWLVHAASSGLDGWYEGGAVVRVPLHKYLARVEKFAGVMVTRF